MLKSGTLILLAIFILISGAWGVVQKGKEKTMADQGDQKLTALSAADLQRLQEQRAVVAKHFSNEDWKRNYQTPAG